MRERNLLYLFLGLNIALAGAFVIYLFLSTNRHPGVVATSFVPPVKTNSAPASAKAAPVVKSNAIAVVTNKAPVATAPDSNAVLASAVKPTFTSKKFGWQDVETDAYRTYIESLRAVGCPNEMVRGIVVADVNELFDKKRLQEAVRHDMQWWRPEAQNLAVVNVLQERGRALEEQRTELIAKLLGEEAATGEKTETLLWSSVQLTGPCSARCRPMFTTKCRRSARDPWSGIRIISGHASTRASP
jgi:hypothetical protein